MERASSGTRASIDRTPDGRRIVVSKTVRATPEAAWALFTDVGRWPEWGPTVSDVKANGDTVRDGLRGRVRVLGGPWVPFRVTSCENRRWTWRVAGVPATGHFVEAVGADRARLGFEVPLWGAGYVPVCERALDRLERMLAARSRPDRG